MLKFCFIHNINSKMAITIFMFKTRFLKIQKVCLSVLLFTELWSTFSVETHLGKNAVNFILVPERITQEIHTGRPVSEHLIFLAKKYMWKKKCWRKKDQVLYLWKNDPVEFVVTLLSDKLFHKPLKPLTKQMPTTCFILWQDPQMPITCFILWQDPTISS